MVAAEVGFPRLDRATLDSTATCGYADGFHEADPHWMGWAIGAILRWQPTRFSGTPVFHVHGGRDLMIRASMLTSDLLLPDGSHLINLSHAAQVNDFIRSVIASLE